MTFIEMLVVVVIIGILLAIAFFNYPELLRKIKMRACIANMRTVYTAAQLALQENPNIPEGKLDIKLLLEKNYLKTPPRCPLNPPTSDPENPPVRYAIFDKTGQPLDIECINTIDPSASHGRLRSLVSLPAPGGQPPSPPPQ